ncbi:hypothetical protein B0H65DRAFT_581412 [Neurospora tetraspora]|uniref:Uncharacterized protein n=1 Tax=Neurospora tetraspora TaxID=94610 RepID=A0AAE0MMV3_9PEZI|nr:hypothetical protein B0H65DRAFT_581412 [Neurospora tetraspora]
MERRMCNLAYFQLCSHVYQQLGEKRDISKDLSAGITKLSKDLRAWDVPKMSDSLLVATIGTLRDEKYNRFEDPVQVMPPKDLDATVGAFLQPGKVAKLVANEQFDDMFDAVSLEVEGERERNRKERPEVLEALAASANHPDAS